MDTASRAALVRACRLELKRFNTEGQRLSDNFEDHGNAGPNSALALTRRRANGVHRDFNRTWDRMRRDTRRQLRRGGINRHRAAIRGQGGLDFATYGPHARQLRNGEP